MKKNKGFFISFEKTKEGLGGSTQASLLADKLQRAGFEVILTKEPGGTGVGQEIRRLLLDPDNQLSKATELFLFMADRSQHYKEVLKPALKEGKIIISDRYFDSTLVYQGNVRGWKNALLWRLHQASTGSLLPDLTVVLDGEPHIKKDGDRIERDVLKLQDKTASAMKHIASKHDRYEVFNANLSVQELADRIYNTVTTKLDSQ